MNKFKRILTLALSLVFVFQVASVFAVATEEPKIIVQDVTTYTGNSFEVTVTAEKLTDVATLDLTLFYDDTIFTLQDVTKGGLLNGTASSVNKSVSGAVSLSMATTTGISGSGTVLTLYFTVNPDVANATSSKIKIAIGEVYNSSLSELTVLGKTGNVEILKTTYVPSTFNLSSSITKTALSFNETTDVVIKNSDWLSFVSADFTFEYDPSLFSVVSVELSDSIKIEGAVYSINTNISGLVKISYANTNAVYTNDLFTVKLKALKETETPISSEVRASCQNVYNSNLELYNPTEISNTLNIVGKKAMLYVDSNKFEVNKSAKSTLKISAGSGVAAGNFYLDYDVNKIRPVTVTVNENATADGSMVVVNPKFNEGRIKLSYLNQSGASSQVDLIDITWDILSGESHISLTPVCADIVDVNYKGLELDSVVSNNCVYTVGTIDVENHPHPLVTSCKECGNSFSTDNFVEECLKCIYDTSVSGESSLALDLYKGNEIVVSIPAAIGDQNVTKISENCFKDNSTLQTVSLPQTITEIGSSAFSGCTALTKITIYKSVKTIGENAFSNCDNLVIYCEENSAIHNYAKENNIDVELIGVKSLTNSEVDCDKNVILVEDDFHTSIETFIALSNDATVTKTPSATYEEKSFYGTGSKITVYDNGVLLGEYTLVVKGDVNGDSVCDVLDCMLVELARHTNNNVSLEGAYLLAGDLAIDGVIDENDLNAVVNRALVI